MFPPICPGISNCVNVLYICLFTMTLWRSAYSYNSKTSSPHSRAIFSPGPVFPALKDAPAMRRPITMLHRNPQLLTSVICILLSLPAIPFPSFPQGPSWDHLLQEATLDSLLHPPPLSARLRLLPHACCYFLPQTYSVRSHLRYFCPSRNSPLAQPWETPGAIDT